MKLTNPHFYNETEHTLRNGEGRGRTYTKRLIYHVYVKENMGMECVVTRCSLRCFIVTE